MIMEFFIGYKSDVPVPQVSTASNKYPRKRWWLVGGVLFLLFAMIQTPAAWVVKKVAADSTYIQHVSGNLWHGAMIWQVPLTDTSLIGAASWSWQPWQLLLGKIGAEVEVTTGQTRLEGQVKVGLQSWQVNDMSGKIAPETLASVVKWELPNAPIQVNKVSLQRQSQSGGATDSGTESNAGFTQAEGQLTWVGGEMGYPSGGKTFYLTLPPLRAQLSAEQKGSKNLLHVNLLNKQDQRLGDLYLDGNNMLDVSLTQRLLENMPEYKGQAPQDTPVVSVRQPLLSGLSGAGMP